MTFNSKSFFASAETQRHSCAHDLFASQAARTPDAPALVFKERCLSYREINQQADALAQALRALGIGTKDLIGICAERAPELPLAMLAVLKAGAAYVPLEPTCPDDRRSAILGDAEPAALLTQRRLVSRFAGWSRPMICLDDELPPRGGRGHSEHSAGANAADLAYVIYTSGSTGKPKGVLIEHRSLVNHATAISRLYDLQPSDRVLQFASFAFDVAAEEIFPTWLSGATVVMWPVISGVAPISKFVEFVDEAKITVLNLPASYWHEWVAELDRVGVPGSVRLVIVGSEKVFCDRVAVWQKHTAGRVRLLNAYGPTEATITATVYEAPSSVSKTSDCLPIGRPIANVQTYVLDENRNALPPGTAGELYIGGVCLARGYLNLPEQTAERFVADPFSDSRRERLYRTGDLVRSLPGGDLEFLGRLDDQVKIRGFRIETGEIETVLRQHPAARNAVVIAREDRPGTKQLVAYLVVENSNRPAPEDLRRFLKARLPDYMIPAAFVLLKGFPLTPGGKVDRRQLPPPEIARDESGKEYVAPQTQLEGELVKIWESLLGVKPIGIRDNFFELGGHSLLEVRLVAEIEKKLGLTLPLIALYCTRTVENLAKILESQRDGRAGSLVLPYRTQGSKPPIFSYGGSTHLADHLGSDQPVYWLRIHGSDGEALPPTVEAMAADYFQAIRRVQPHGPYYLIGYCLGALVMFELAQQLARAGEKTALVLIDPFVPFFPPSADGSDRQPPRRFIDKLARRCRGLFSAGFLRKAKQLPRAIPRRIRWAKRLSKWFFCDLWVRSGRRLPPSLREFYLDQQTDDAVHGYVPGVFPGPLMVFRRLDNGTEAQWRALATGEVAMYDGWVDHNEFLEEPYVQVIAAKIRDHIERGEIEISEKIDSEKPNRQPKKPTQARHHEVATTVET
jgi:amino acid adenylation domain-containing protein